jgi:hypothetical protein
MVILIGEDAPQPNGAEDANTMAMSATITIPACGDFITGFAIGIGSSLLCRRPAEPIQF